MRIRCKDTQEASVKTILVAVALSSLVFGQNVPATPAFEVADIKTSAYAKAGTDVPIPTISLMMQGLLAERFKLTFHREEKPMSAYVLKVGTRPAKYQQGAGGRQDCNWSTLESGLARRTCHNLS